MKTLAEIFKTKPDLLETKEVKELVEQFRVQFEAYKKKHLVYWDKVTNLTINSDLFVINGMDCKKVVEKIHELSFKID